MKKGMRFVLIIILLISALNFISSAEIEDNLHLNIQVMNSSGDIKTGSYTFTFNISTSEDCANVVYFNESYLTTDSRGIISYYLENTGLNYANQYWLCYYRNFVLINASKIARNPYAFRARNVSLTGVEPDTNFNMGIYNLTTTGTGFFSWLGSLTTRVIALFVNAIDFSGNINGTGNITAFGRIGIGTETPSQTLDVRGQGNFSGIIYINNATDISSYGTFNTTGNIQALINGTNMNFGNVDFNNGWQSGGASVIDGSLFAQTVYVYNLTSLNVNTLMINGSLIPPVDNTFDIGNSSLRWKDLYLSGRANISGFFYANSTNVGIGTSNPSQMLEVNGTILIGKKGVGIIGRSDAQIEIQNDGSGHAMISSVMLQNPPTNVYENAWSGQAYDSAGNMVQQGAFYMRWQNVSTGIGNGYSVLGMHPNYNGGLTADVSFEVYGNHGILMFGGASATPPYANYLQIKKKAGYPSIMGSTSLVLDGNNATSSGVYINNYSSGKIILGLGGGNVGIGTNTPSQTLDVRGQGNFSSILYYNNATSITALNDTAFALEINSTLLNNAPWNVSGTNVYLNKLGDKVGIGSDTPLDMLYIVSTRSSSYPGITINTTDTNGMSGITTYSSGNANGQFLTFGSTRTGDTFKKNSPDANWSMLYVTGTFTKGLVVGTFYSQPLVFGTGNTMRMLITAGGNVGIGINLTNPAYPLEINNASMGLNVSGMLYANSTSVNLGLGNTFLNISGLYFGGIHINTTISMIANLSANLYQTVTNATLTSVNTTLNIQQLYNYTASLITNFSINDFLNKTINQYFSLANISIWNTANANYTNLTTYIGTINTTNYNYANIINGTAGLVFGVNKTVNIEILYNNSASIIANLSATFYQTVTNASMSLYNNTLLNNAPWNVSGTNVYLNVPTNNVGIGTNTPSQILDVRGQGNFSGTIYINNATNLLSYWNKNSKTSNVVSYNKGNISIAGKLSVNQTDGFKTSAVGGDNPRGIIQDLRDNSFWVLDYTDDFVYHVSSTGVNQSDGFSVSAVGGGDTVDITQDLRDNSFWVTDVTDNFVYHVSSTGVNQSDGFSVSAVGSDNPFGITQDLRDNSFWIVDNTDDFVYHVSSTGVNQSDGFSVSAVGSDDTYGITQDLRDNSFWITDITDDVVYHVSSTGVNQSDGFSTLILGNNQPVGITFDLRDNSFWITDNLDDFVYHVSSTPLLFGDYNTGNVGIGTANPTHTLNVVGTANITGNVWLGDNVIDMVNISGNVTSRTITGTGNNTDDLGSVTRSWRRLFAQTISDTSTGFNINTQGSALVLISQMNFSTDEVAHETYPDSLIEKYIVKDGKETKVDKLYLPKANEQTFWSRDLGGSLSLSLAGIKELNAKVILLEKENEDMKESLCNLGATEWC